jgi:hypothetical protein
MVYGVALDPHEFLSDPQVRPFARDQRVDLTAPNVPRTADNIYVCFRNKTDRQKIDVVRYIVPYAMERTDVGTPQESFRYIEPDAGNGFFSYSPLVNGQTPVVLEVNYNAPRNAAGPLNNADRIVRSGITGLSKNPWIDAQRYSPLFSIPVPSEVDFLVTFEILPLGTGGALSNPYEVGTGAKRVDFAGCMVYGVTMPQTLYNRVIEQVQRNGN